MDDDFDLVIDDELLQNFAEGFNTSVNKSLDDKTKNKENQDKQDKQDTLISIPVSTIKKRKLEEITNNKSLRASENFPSKLRKVIDDEPNESPIKVIDVNIRNSTKNNNINAININTNNKQKVQQEDIKDNNINNINTINNVNNTLAEQPNLETNNVEKKKKSKKNKEHD